MSAVWITLSRFPLLLLSVLTFYFGAPGVQLAGTALLFAGLMLDTVDGIVARRTGQTSLFGGVLDIAADRTYELVLWVGFADLGLVPPWIPMLILVRTTLTDAFRSLGVSQGVAPFDQQPTGLGRFLVASPAMRIAYSAGKVATFCGLPLGRALGALPAGAAPDHLLAALGVVVEIALYATVVLCVLRGLPVILGVPRQWSPALQRSR
ncbi:MAG TPA: CDP-alcohol phosphatidyltransferase family protein [Gemmatimonadales bacterium]|nr:CDP-alcohol phosphatidyltransferase family protein [Gemmatimonadales bacterium]